MQMAGSCESKPDSPSFERLDAADSAHLRSLPRKGLEADTPPAREPNEGLVKLFVERTGLPLYLGGEEKWAQALARMQQAGVEEADLEQAIDECRTRG